MKLHSLETHLNHLEEHTGWLNDFDHAIARLSSRLIEIRRHLHAHPEPSGEEIQTTTYLTELLQAVGLNPVVKQNDIGLTVDFEIGNPDPTTPLIAIRADIDALRIPDEKQVPYRSQNDGVMHACGHDAHSTIVTGIGLAAMGAELTEGVTNVPAARVRLLFQPAEETCQGARWMIEQNSLDGVAAILSLHMEPERAVGEAAVRYGTMTANCDEVQLTVTGHGGHAARPHHTSDPVAASAELIMALHQYLPRSVDSRHPSVFSVGQLMGGYAPNVIPETVEIRGSLRTIQADTRERLHRRIREIAHGVGKTSGTLIDVDFHNALPSIVNNNDATRCLELAAMQILGTENTSRIDQPSMGGEDFALYLEQVPGAMIRLGCARDISDPTLLHSCRFDIDETVLSLGARIIMRSVLLLGHQLETTSGESL
ncbi:putative hydrolase YxeP [Polystyrenella longa]|uniref:Putative hydrolase YxeP n=1 Tax=Polystyrenella longa TaxID=2528007 RepID=A0A518CID8_9PLAN|nr:amidohydrolase [Polystyrenella longa]QDU78991.1 putative hydrolase YxeP [Polystyrenella longa]